MNKMQYNLSDSRRGFTLLIASLIASVVVTLGAAIYSIAIKEIELSSISRDSQMAFFAADSGTECALYWDFNVGASTTAPVFATDNTVVPYTEISCDANLQVPRNSHIPLVVASDASAATTTFWYEQSATSSEKYCVDVTVAKYLSGGAPRTVITGNGYSSSCDATSTARVTLQRSVQLRY